jgi:Region found in RelA / SpoT proteins
VIDDAFCSDSIKRVRDLAHDDDAWLADMANWAVPEYPRNQVDKAGAILITPNADFKIDEFLWALSVINNWRSSHSYPLLHFRINLTRNLKRIEPNAIVAQRIKRLESISTKLGRGTMELSQMQDIGGCRGIVSSTKNLDRIIELYMKSSSPHILKGQKNYLLEPKEDGYRSHHLIYQYHGSLQNACYNKMRIEIQLRTKLQHAWATAVEAVGIFTKQALKSNIGDKDWLRLFALMSSEIAVDEKTPLIPNTPLERPQRIKEIRQLAHKLRAIKTLNAYRAAIEWVGRRKKIDARYFIMQYDYDENKVTVSKFSANQSVKAYTEYTNAEQKVKADTKNIVLVSVDSVNALKKAYPNYFLDTQNFANLLIQRLT